MTLSATTDEATFAVALYEPRLRDVPEEDLKNALRYVFALIGIRGKNIPVDPEKTFLHAHIRKNYGGHTLAEVRLAFDMAVGGKLGVEANCFENFSPLYFSSIMNAYRKWSAQEYRRIEFKPVETKPTPEQLAQIEREYQAALDWDQWQANIQVIEQEKRKAQEDPF